ncbi:hypothetical protein DFH09DRAFT_423681 [Mycena vulgaris]|nr:hypothetical protein DFH09DRAFT_423681 [Mycena vulgaris]
MSTPEFFRFTPEELPGVIVVNAFAILSTFALLTVAFRVIWLAIARYFSNSKDAQSREYVFFNTVLGNYAACLLIANIISGAAGIMGLNHLLNRGIQEGPFCTIQAIVMQVANFAGAYFTVAIGVHTFNSLVLARRQSAWICGITIAVGWIVSGVLAAAPTLYDSPAFPKSMFFFHLLPIFITSIMSALLYSIIFLALRGTLVLKGGLKLALDPNERWGGNVQNYHRFVARIARSMLWFPIAYILFLVPYSVTRLIDLSGRVCPYPLLVAGYVCWFMLGMGNVLTLYNTFRVLGPAFDARSTSQKDLESNNGSTGVSSRVMPPMIAAGDREYSYRPSESMSEKSRPNSLASFNQVQVANSENYGAAPFQLMAPPFAARIQERREEYTSEPLQRTHSRTDSERSEWTVNMPSYYDYGSTPEIENGPRPKTRLSQLLLNEPVVNGAPSRVRSSRYALPPSQSEPAQSLPAPPRRQPAAQRQVSSQRSVTVSLNSPVDSVEVRYSSTPSTTSEELDVSGWLNQQRPDGYMPRGLISAVGNNYSVPPIPADAVPLPAMRSGSVDITRSRSAIAAGTRQQRGGEPYRPRGNSSPEPPKL